MPKRFTAEQRRDDLIEAAIIEFARHGYREARTADIARRAGVSQPYVYALFPDKQALFVACFDRSVERIRCTLRAAREDTPPGISMDVWSAQMQRQMIDDHPDQALFQLQALTVAEPETRARVRAAYVQLVDEGTRLGDVPKQHVLNLMSRAVLDSIMHILEVPAEYRLDLVSPDKTDATETSQRHDRGHAS